MGIRIDLNVCHGCVKLPEARCVMACPGDLIGIRKEDQKAFMRVQADCWDCYACVKPCPVGAVEVVLPYSVAAENARLMPKVRRETIRWTLETEGKDPEFFDAPTRVPDDLIAELGGA